MAILVQGFGKPTATDDLKPGDYFVARIGKYSVFALQTDFMVQGANAPMIAILAASEGFSEDQSPPFMIFQDHIGDVVLTVDDSVVVRPHGADLPYITTSDENYVRGSLALGVDNAVYIRSNNGGGGYLWLNLTDGSTGGAPKMPFFYRRWRLTVGQDDQLATLASFGNQ